MFRGGSWCEGGWCLLLQGCKVLVHGGELNWIVWLQCSKGLWESRSEATTSAQTRGVVSSWGSTVPLLLLPRSKPSTKGGLVPKKGAWIDAAVPLTTLVQGTAGQRGR